MSKRHERMTRNDRILLIAAAVRGILAGASRAVVGWLISVLAEGRH
jgi:hypothetical protein